MKRAGIAVLVALSVGAGCGKSTQPADKRPTSGDATGSAIATGSGSGDSNAGGAGSGSTMKTASGATFVKGSALTPSKDLAKWMSEQKLDGKPKLLRLPLVLEKGPRGFDVSKAKIGGGADALVVYANDSSLGIGLADRAKQACKDSAATTCAFWVEGYWNEQSMAGGPELDVKKAEPLAAGDLAGATHAQVEGESGN